MLQCFLFKNTLTTIIRFIYGFRHVKCLADIEENLDLAEKKDIMCNAVIFDNKCNINAILKLSWFIISKVIR